MQYEILHKQDGCIEAEFWLPVEWLNHSHSRLLNRYREKGQHPPALEALQSQIDQLTVQRGLNYFYQAEQVTSWEAPDWEVLQRHPQKGLQVAITLEILPDLRLGAYQQLMLDVPPVPVPSEDMLLSRLVDQQYALARATEAERPIQEGDRVILDMVGLNAEGLPLPFTSRSELEVLAFEGAIAPGFVEQLIGLQVGDSREIRAVLPTTYAIKALQGQPVTFDVYVSKVFALEFPPLEKVPEIMGFASMEALMQQLYDELVAENQDTWFKLVRKQLLVRVAVSTDPEIPDSLLEAELISRWERLEEPGLKAQGLSHALCEQALEVWLAQEELRDEVYVELACSLVARAIAQREQLDVTPADMLTAIQPMLEHFEISPAALVAELQRTGQLAQIANQLVTEMVIDFIYERATLTCGEEVLKTAAVLV